MFRSSFFLGIALLIGVGMTLLFVQGHQRFVITPQGNGVFVFDRKYTKMSFCTSGSCTMIASHFEASPPTLPPSPALLPSQSEVTQAFIPAPTGPLTGKLLSETAKQSTEEDPKPEDVSTEPTEEAPESTKDAPEEETSETPAET